MTAAVYHPLMVWASSIRVEDPRVRAVSTHNGLSTRLASAFVGVSIHVLGQRMQGASPLGCQCDLLPVRRRCEVRRVVACVLSFCSTDGIGCSSGPLEVPRMYSSCPSRRGVGSRWRCWLVTYAFARRKASLHLRPPHLLDTLRTIRPTWSPTLHSL